MWARKKRWRSGLRSPGEQTRLHLPWRKRFRRATIALSVLFLKGTVSRVRAAILLTGIPKTRKMQSFEQQRLASALHLATALRKAKGTSWMNERSRIEEICAEVHGDASQRTSANRCPPSVLPQHTPRTTSQNPQKSAAPTSPEARAALLSLEAVLRGHRGGCRVCR
jgi:hypothetical protein